MSDGLSAPLNAPPAGTVSAGVQPGVTSGVVVAQIVVVYGGGAISGIFLYSPAPGPGNLVGYWTTQATKDPYGTATLPPGLSIGPSSAPQLFLTTATGGSGAALQLPSNTADAGLAAELIMQVINSGAANQLMQLLLQGPSNGTAGGGQFSIAVSSASDDSTIPASLVIYDQSLNPYLSMTNTGTPVMSIGLSPSGSGSFIQTQLNGALLSYGAAGVQITQAFTSNSQSPFVCPAGVTAASWTAQGAGAGGRYASGPGGGSGEIANEPAAAMTPGNSYAFTIGSGGTRGTSGAPNGTGGGNTSITLDAVTVTAHGAPGISSGTSTGGTGSTNTSHRNGSGCTSTIHVAEGGGGGAGAPSLTAPGGNGGAASGTAPGAGGHGGSGSIGQGGGGGGWGSVSSDAATTGGGNGGYGAGGGTGGAGPSGGGSTGGFGGGGVLQVTYTAPGTATIVASQASAAGTDSGGRPFPVGFGGVNIPLVAQTTATQAFTLASAVLVTGLSVALVPGTYAVTIDLVWVPSGTIGSTHQHYIAFSGTASASAWNTVMWQAQAANAIQQTMSQQTGTAFPIASGASPTHVAFAGWTTVTGRIVVTASGTLAAGIVLALANNGITTQPGSSMTVTRTA